MMLPYDCMNLLWSFAAIIAEIFCLAPTARTRQRQSAGETSAPVLPSLPASAERAWAGWTDQLSWRRHVAHTLGACTRWTRGCKPPGRRVCRVRRTSLHGDVQRPVPSRLLKYSRQLRQERVRIEQRHGGAGVEDASPRLWRTQGVTHARATVAETALVDKFRFL
jgi:hypothetical protein